MIRRNKPLLAPTAPASGELGAAPRDQSVSMETGAAGSENTDELDKLRKKNKELNRRCQKAESVIAKSGIVEGREQGPKGRSLGRALANYAASHATLQVKELEARLTAAETKAALAGILHDALANHGVLAYIGKHLTWLQNEFTRAKNEGRADPYPGADIETLADYRAVKSALAAYSAAQQGGGK